jgi:hypothetical protein
VKVDFDAIGGEELRETLTPFDEDDGVAFEEFVEAEGGDFAGLVEAIEIDVIDAGRVLVDESESGTGYFVRRDRWVEPGDDALGESCFAGAEIADEEYDRAPRELGR